MARQKLGQHFLANEAWQRRIAQTLPTDANTAWLEIGAGHGEMTEFLAQRSRRVVAVETDSALAAALSERAATEWPNVEIIKSDILSTDLAALARRAHGTDSRQGTASALPKNSPAHPTSGNGVSLETRKARKDEPQRFRVYGNLPYYITSPILSHLFGFNAQIESIHIVIQWEVAQRIGATPGHREYGYLSTLCQYFTRPEILLRIPAGAFRPPPKVTSALIAMNFPGESTHLNIADDRTFLKFLQQCFAQKRKTLRNNLKTSFADSRLRSVLTECTLAANSRAEELSLRQFAALFRLLAARR